MRWSPDLTMKFIQQYKMYPCLWNFQSMDSKSVRKRYKACVAIAQSMNLQDFGIEDVKTKIKNLRSTYLQEIKKINKSIKNGGPAYVPKIPWIQDFKEVYMTKSGKKITSEENFEEDFETVSRSSSDFSTTLDTTNVKQEPLTFADCHDDDKTEDGVLMTKGESEPITNEEYVLVQQHESTSGNQAISRKRKHNDSSFNNYSKRRNIEIEIGGETLYDTFGRSVAQQLKALSVGNAMIAQSKIQNILSKIGIKNYKEKEACKCFQSDASDGDL
ncbi:uncharacterized protein LOC105389229 [Plutella xylostella]|uniref:uncharacterized protein LOC105389229 n=1 Tax=Plutella xylostella TaxID=51655 RepID=UPI0020322553|nr:uncharacterized protein LOC105389229 [Plutella xylostella]